MRLGLFARCGKSVELLQLLSVESSLLQVFLSQTAYTEGSRNIQGLARTDDPAQHRAAA